MKFIPFVCLLLATGCAAPPPPPVVQPEPEPDPEPEFTFDYEHVWTRSPAATIRVDSASEATIQRPFARLAVLDAEADSVRVRCESCSEPVEGWMVWDDLVYEPVAPDIAALGTLGEFALAVREAAAARDIEALRAVMSRDFTSSLIGPQGRDVALAGWEAQRWAALDLVVALLDRGLSTRDSRLWAAPPEHLETLDYRGSRLGLRRAPDGRWEWVFLIVNFE